MRRRTKALFAMGVVAALFGGAALTIPREDDFPVPQVLRKAEFAGNIPPKFDPLGSAVYGKQKYYTIKMPIAEVVKLLDSELTTGAGWHRKQARSILLEVSYAYGPPNSGSRYTIGVKPGNGHHTIAYYEDWLRKRADPTYARKVETPRWGDPEWTTIYVTVPRREATFWDRWSMKIFNRPL